MGGRGLNRVSTKLFVVSALAVLIVAACSTVEADSAPPEASNVFFESGEAEPNENADYFELGRVARTLEQDEKLHLLVVGHTDSRGSKKSNRKLAFKRASRVHELICDAVPGVRARSRLAFHGEEKPIRSNRTTEGRAMNRRVELFFYYLAEGEDEESKLQSSFDGKLEFRAGASIK